MTHICVSKLAIINSDNWLATGWITWLATSHYLNQCYDIVNWTNKLQWNLNRNSNIFIKENAFENVVCEMASFLSRSQCVKQCDITFPSIHPQTHPPNHPSHVDSNTSSFTGQFCCMLKSWLYFIIDDSLYGKLASTGFSTQGASTLKSQIVQKYHNRRTFGKIYQRNWQ